MDELYNYFIVLHDLVKHGGSPAVLQVLVEARVQFSCPGETIFAFLISFKLSQRQTHIVPG